MRYPAQKKHPLVEILEDARYYNMIGFKAKAQKLLDKICRDLGKTEKELGKEDYESSRDFDYDWRGARDYNDRNFWY